MDRGRVGEDRESKETDGCPLTSAASRECSDSIRGSLVRCLVSLVPSVVDCPIVFLPLPLQRFKRVDV
jgi:hypothetical protein